MTHEEAMLSFSKQLSTGILLQDGSIFRVPCKVICLEDFSDGLSASFRANQVYEVVAATLGCSHRLRNGLFPTRRDIDIRLLDSEGYSTSLIFVDKFELVAVTPEVEVLY